MKRNTMTVLMTAALLAAPALSEAKVQGSGLAIADAVLLHAKVEREHRAEDRARRTSTATPHAAEEPHRTDTAAQST